MGKGKITKTVGKLSDEVINRYGLHDFRNIEITQSMDLYLHVVKHREEFQSIDSYNNTLSKIPEIISNPRLVYYDKQRNSLLYFKKIDENVCSVVKLNIRKKEIYVASVFPVSENKIIKYTELSYINQ